MTTDIGLVVGLTVGVIVLVTVLLAALNVLIYVMLRRKRNKNESDENYLDEQEMKKYARRK